MVTSVSICNLALGRLGAYRISSLSDTQREARLCNEIYDSLRKIVLEDHNWTFAKKRVRVALATGEYTGWDYAYQVPVGCLIIRKIINETFVNTITYYDVETQTYVKTGEVEYELIVDDGAKLILTNQESAELEYTADIEDATLFSNKFVDALAWRVCADLVQPLKGKVNLQVQAMNMYINLLGDAKARDSQQDSKKPNDQSSFVGAR